MKPSILIVDDSIISLKIINKLLKNYNLNITIIDCPLKALKLITNYYYEFVISDISMPNINGYELIDKIKEINTKVKVILISFYENKTNYKYFIKKPLNNTKINQLVLQINNYMQ